MIWGEFLLSLDDLHKRLFHKFRDFPKDLPALPPRIFKYPSILTTEESYSYQPDMSDPQIFLHPVTRFLLEGPISPNQAIHSNKRFLDDVFHLEQEALHQICATMRMSPDEMEIRSSWLQTEWERLIKETVPHESGRLG